MNEREIGQFIKTLRLEHNMSQDDLGEIVHVTRQAVSRWETGKSIPDSGILMELSKLFGVSVNEILAGGKEKNENLEEIALKLVDENNKKKTRIKKIRITFSILFSSILVLFLGYYFINNYNSISVYTITGQSENFKIENALMLTTNQKMYLKLDKIKKVKDENININSMKLLYIDKEEKEHTIFKSKDESRLIRYDYKNSTENDWNKATIKNSTDSMYLEINFDDDKMERMKLDLREEFKNNFLKEKEIYVYTDKSNENLSNKENKNHMLEKVIEEKNQILETSSKIRNEETNFMRNSSSSSEIKIEYVPEKTSPVINYEEIPKIEEENKSVSTSEEKANEVENQEDNEKDDGKEELEEPNSNIENSNVEEPNVEEENSEEFANIKDEIIEDTNNNTNDDNNNENIGNNENNNDEGNDLVENNNDENNSKESNEENNLEENENKNSSDIDYEEVAKFVEENGFEIAPRMYMYFFMNDDEMITITADNYFLILETQDKNIIETWQLDYNDNNLIISYAKSENYEMIETKEFTNSDSNILIDKMNEYFLLAVQGNN